MRDQFNHETALLIFNRELTRMNTNVFTEGNEGEPRKSLYFNLLRCPLFPSVNFFFPSAATLLTANVFSHKNPKKAPPPQPFSCLIVFFATSLPFCLRQTSLFRLSAQVWPIPLSHENSQKNLFSAKSFFQNHPLTPSDPL